MFRCKARFSLVWVPIIVWAIAFAPLDTASAQPSGKQDDRVPSLQTPRALLNGFRYCIRTATLRQHHRIAAGWIVEWFDTIQQLDRCNLPVIAETARPDVRRSMYHILLRSLPESAESALPNVSIEQCRQLGFAIATEVDEAMHRLAEWLLDSELLCRQDAARRQINKADEQLAAKALELVRQIKNFSE